jgi:hypothetical protein
METKQEVTLHSFIGKAQYDPNAQMIWAMQASGHRQWLVDLRGWGGVQQPFDTNLETAMFQKKLGYWLAEAINQKLTEQTEKSMFTDHFFTAVTANLFLLSTVESNPESFKAVFKNVKLFYKTCGKEKEDVIALLKRQLGLSDLALNSEMRNTL